MTAAIETGFSNGVAPAALYEFNIDPSHRLGHVVQAGLREPAGLCSDWRHRCPGGQALFSYLQGMWLPTRDQHGLVGVNAVGSKYEPEGLSLVKDPNSHQRYLYFTMMFGDSGDNIKRLHAIAPASFDLGGNYSNSPIPWMIRYNTNSGEVDLHPARMVRWLRRQHLVQWLDQLRRVPYWRRPYLLLQKETPGTVKIYPLEWDAEADSATKDDDWSNGWIISIPGSTRRYYSFITNRGPQALSDAGLGAHHRRKHRLLLRG